MEFEERIEKARQVLGEDARILTRNRRTKKKTRSVSSFIPRKTKGHHDMSQSEYRQCGKKIRYNSEPSARKYAAKLSAERGYPIRVYQCEFCNGYHLTHK